MNPESMILCGGASQRLKPYLPFNKALVKISSGTSLLHYQTSWLKKKGIRRIVLAIDRETYNSLEDVRSPLLDEAVCSIEEEMLGTGGAVSKSLQLVKAPVFYLMNVDDILFSNMYTPLRLLGIHGEKPQAAGAILLARTQFPFGVVETSTNMVTSFRQKPTLDYKVCAGHYTFTKKAVKQYFPEKGNFEDSALPRMAQDRCLYSHELKGEWITINDIKQLEEAKQRLASWKIRARAKTEDEPELVYTPEEEEEIKER